MLILPEVLLLLRIVLAIPAQAGTTTLEISLAVPQKMEKSFMLMDWQD